MISRFAGRACHVLRNTSVNPCVKVYSWKECKLFHSSSVFFNTKEDPKKSSKAHADSKLIKVWKDITVREIYKAMNISLSDLRLLLPELNLKPNDRIGSLDVISEPLHKSGWKLQVVKNPKKEKYQEGTTVAQENVSKAENLVKRPPVVTVMGHVDHGKTTLLDSLRNSFVTQQEFGGITQHIGAFSVEVKPGERITFIDTPGHAAFTAMRSRGAEVTDIVVLVIAADDGVMEQTIESIKIANAAEVPMVIAVNKIDKTGAQSVDDIKQKLLVEGIQVEDQGGDVQLVPISALKKINLDELTEVILLQAELMNLKGDPTGPVAGVVVESKRGPAGILATIIVKRGTVRKEKILVAGNTFARVRKMVDENGIEYKEATPSTPVQILGWKQLPSAGDKVYEVQSEKQAKSILAELERKEMEEKREAERRAVEKKAAEHKQQHRETKAILSSFTSSKEKRVFFFEWRQQTQREQKQLLEEEQTGPHLKILLKGDVFGSLEVLMEILGSYDKQDECKLTIIDASVGDIKSSDLEMANYFGAVIYAFNVGLQHEAKEFLKEKTADIRYHNVLYKMVDDVKEELTARIPPKDEEEFNGEAEVLQNFQITSGKKKVPVAGSRCTKGQLNKDSLYRIFRGDQVLYEGKLAVMKNEKKIVKVITKGMECGLLFESFTDKFKPGDRIVCYDLVKRAQRTSWDPGF